MFPPPPPGGSFTIGAPQVDISFSVTNPPPFYAPPPPQFYAPPPFVYSPGCCYSPSDVMFTAPGTPYCPCAGQNIEYSASAYGNSHVEVHHKHQKNIGPVPGSGAPCVSPDGRHFFVNGRCNICGHAECEILGHRTFYAGRCATCGALECKLRGHCFEFVNHHCISCGRPECEITGDHNFSCGRCIYCGRILQ